MTKKKKEDIFNKGARIFVESRVGKVFLKGISKVLEETIEEGEEVATEFVNNEMKKKTQKLKDALKGNEDGEKENTENSE